MTSALTWPSPASSQRHRVDKRLNEKWPRPSLRKKQAEQERNETITKYGVGMVLGFIAVHLTKRLINRIPVVKHITRPLLGLVPTLLVGPALGAGLTYGVLHGDGDLLAARHRVKEGAEVVGKELDSRVKVLQESIRREMPRLEASGRSTARQLEASSRQLMESVNGTMEDMEQELVPILDRRRREAQHHLDKIKRDWDDDRQ